MTARTSPFVFLLFIAITAVAQEPPPPIPDEYEVIDLSPYRPVAMNDVGDVLLGDERFDTITGISGQALTQADYYLWRDENGDRDVDEAELTFVCRYSHTFGGIIKPSDTPFSYQSSSSEGCRPVAVNNNRQVLGTNVVGTLEVVNCSNTQCGYKSTERTAALLWKEDSSILIDGLSPVNTFSNGSTRNDLHLNSLDNSGRFTGFGRDVNPQRESQSSPFLWDQGQQLLTVPDLFQSFEALRNDQGLIAYRNTNYLLENGSLRQLPTGIRIGALNNFGDVLGEGDLGLTMIRADGAIVPIVVPEGTSLVQRVTDRGQVAVGHFGAVIADTGVLLFQDDNQDGFADDAELYRISEHLPADVSPSAASQLVDISNRGELLVTEPRLSELPQGLAVYHNPKAYLLRPSSSWLAMVVLAYDDAVSQTAAEARERVDLVLNDLEAAAQNEAVTIVALVDSPDAGDTAYYVIEPDDDDQALAMYEDDINRFPQGELDLSNPGPLIQFVDWARQRFPASHELLMLDGAGGPGGLLVDDTAADAVGFMTMAELQVTLTEIGNDRRLDALVLQQPNLAMLEVAFAVRDGARFMIASQERIWRGDDNYRRMIERLPPVNANLAAVMTNITSALAATRTFNDGPVAGLPLATSVVDTDQIDYPLDLANFVALTLNADLATYAPHIQTALDTVQRFDSNDDLTHTDSDDVIDLVDFVIRLQVALSQAGFDQDSTALLSETLTNTLLDTLVLYVLQHWHSDGVTSTFLLDVSDSTGVSIFFPRHASHFYDAANYGFASGAVWNSGPASRQAQAISETAPAWGELLVNYFQLIDPDGVIVTDLPRLNAAAPLPGQFELQPLFADGFE